MKLEQAAQPKKEFKRPYHDTFLQVSPQADELGQHIFIVEDGQAYVFSVEDIQADDWETRGEK